jgi:ribosomal protein L37AE/L43A
MPHFHLRRLVDLGDHSKTRECVPAMLMKDLIRFCPFCGKTDLKFKVGTIITCKSCRTLFAINHWRRLRKAPERKK